MVRVIGCPEPVLIKDRNTQQQVFLKQRQDVDLRLVRQYGRHPVICGAFTDHLVDLLRIALVKRKFDALKFPAHFGVQLCSDFGAKVRGDADL